jgi:hypothetical protein
MKAVTEGLRRMTVPEDISRLAKVEMAEEDARLRVEISRLKADFESMKTYALGLDDWNDRLQEDNARLKAELAKQADITLTMKDELLNENARLRAALAEAEIACLGVYVKRLLSLVEAAHIRMRVAGEWDWVVRADAALALTPRQIQPPESHASATAKPEKNCTSA